MVKHLFYSIVLQTLVVTLVSPALAAEKQGVNVSLTAKKITTNDKKEEQLISASEALPGDVIEYKATYINDEKRNVKDVLATLPIPAGAEVLPGSFNPRNPQASLDGKKFDAIPLKKTVTLPNGQQEVRLVPYSEYRYLRWDLGTMSTGKSTTVTSRVRITQLAKDSTSAN